MQTVPLVSAFVMVAVVFMTTLQTADAECCKAFRMVHHGKKICSDCKSGTPYCGIGKCNMFGCACKDGCLQGFCYHISQRKRSVFEEPSIETVESIMSDGDVNGDGVLSVEEAEIMVQQEHGPNPLHHMSVRSLDKNRDGLLSAEEIDY